MAELLILWENAGPRALVDIAIISVAVFLLIRTFRVSGTGRLALGITIAASIFLMASLLDLRAIMWLYNRLSPVLLIVAVVMFQPELRRILEQTASLRRSGRTSLSDRLSSLVVDLLGLLSQRGWGAILVFQGKQPVERWLTGGVLLNAEPSVALLLSLFDPHSPGHDGAVVFMGERVDRFAVRLPLSQSNRLDPQLGTRHNASLGLSESTDALVLTVSEERGTISAFEDGVMKPLASAASAASLIRRHLRATNRVGLTDAVERRGTRHALQVGISIAASIALWVGVTLPSGQIVQRTLEAPLEYATPANLALLGPTPASVTLHVAGADTVLRELDGSSAYVRLNLSEAGPGSQVVFITDEAVRLPREVQLLDVVPSSVELTLQAIAERAMSIVPQLVGSLPAGFRLTGVTVTPATVRAITPNRAEMRELTTTPIYLLGLRSDLLLQAKVVAPPGIQPVDRRWPDVEVHLRIEEVQD